MPEDTRKLLVLDLDETLIYASETPLARPADFRLFDYHIYRRPHLDHFLATVDRHYRCAVWSSASDDYVAEVVGRIIPPHMPLEFVWGRSRATMRRVITDDRFPGDAFDHRNYRKPLAKVKRLGWQLADVLIVDDTPAKSAQNYGNAIYPREWEGDPQDDELLLLAKYLPALAGVANVRAIEKRNWRAKARDLP